MDFWIQICYYLKKGCRGQSRGTNDLLFMILREVKMREQNLSMAWIDYDMVPHLWIIDCLETVGINEKI